MADTHPEGAHIFHIATVSVRIRHHLYIKQRQEITYRQPEWGRERV